MLCSGCSSRLEIEQRLRHYFGISTGAKVNPGTIQSAILRDLSTGVSAQTIYDYLDKKGIGRDGLSSYYPINPAGEIVCRVDFNPKAFDLVKKSYVIIFSMETNDQLKNVSVKENLTGL